MEFSVPVTRNEVYKMLAQRRWDKKKESLQSYVLAMQAIAKRAKVEEQEVIEFVIDGIRNIVPNAHLLLPTRTLAELKTLIQKYERKYLVSDVVATTGRRQATKTVVDAKQKCYNCSRDGHIKPNCPYPLRPDGSCFRCWRMGHDHRSCPNPAKILKPKTQVASVMEGGDDESYDVNTYNFVSIIFKLESKIFSEEVFSLFDTGSPVSFIGWSRVLKQLFEYKNFQNTNTPKYKGIGGNQINIISKIKCLVKFNNRINKIELNVISDEDMVVPVIMGRDFLHKFHIRLKYAKKGYTKSKLLDRGRNMKTYMIDEQKIVTDSETFSAIVKLQPKQKVNVNPSDLTAEFCTNVDKNIDVNPEDLIAGFRTNVDSNINDDIDIDCILTNGQRNRLKKVIDDTYFKSNIKPEPLEYEMKSHLTTDVPFHYAPRRLSYAERNEVQTIIDELLKEQAIQPSYSPYASAIVL
ncbi:PREDICTED: uncharacterized protein LOC108356381, partial [Rhagoletis zephyria]|uniref:uncharacterized protein LOC108356381 n=1 Tax=Rhagoletis zephyria TaxID=28612 RepID=UPI00081139AB